MNVRDGNIVPRRRSPSRRRLVPGLVRGLEAVAVLGLIAGYAALERRDDGWRARQAEAERTAQALVARLEQLSESSGTEIESLKTSLAVVGDSARAREDLLRHEIDRASAALGAQERRISQMRGLQEERLTKSELDLGHRIEELAAQLAVDRSSRETAADRFHVIQQRADESVYLLHCVFTYETRELDDEWKEHQATTWGTAFAVSSGGHLVTNKHLVMPWKFDSELSALRALGEVRIREDSVQLAVWPVGTNCLDAKKRANIATGCSTERGTLEVVATAADCFKEKSIEMAGKTVRYDMHALDNHDLALLKIDRETRALPFAEEHTTPLKKLDPVLAIGFPRGVGGLESDLAVPSATVGAVRKIEDTIHISAPIVAGNSGGPVLDSQGRVIGIATRIYCETLGICIKADHVRAMIEDARVGKKPASIAANVPGN